jgi:hypothetical protein
MLGAAGLLSSTVAQNNDLPRRLFREDLHRELLNSNPTHEIATSSPARDSNRQPN